MALSAFAVLKRIVENLAREIWEFNNQYDPSQLFTLVDSLQLPFPVSQRLKTGFVLTQPMSGPHFRPVTVVDRLSDMEHTIEIIYEKGVLTVIRHTIEISSESLWLRTLYVLRSFAV